jgi:hypothetical protein
MPEGRRDWPAWVRCGGCSDYLCTIHGLHAHECPCPAIEDWGDLDPYRAGGRSPRAAGMRKALRRCARGRGRRVRRRRLVSGPPCRQMTGHPSGYCSKHRPQGARAIWEARWLLEDPEGPHGKR